MRAEPSKKNFNLSGKSGDFSVMKSALKRLKKKKAAEFLSRKGEGEEKSKFFFLFQADFHPSPAVIGHFGSLLPLGEVRKKRF